jgi:hypothetical protein
VLEDLADYASHARDWTYGEVFTPLGSPLPRVGFTQHSVGCSLRIPGLGRYKVVADLIAGTEELFLLQDASGAFVDPFETLPLGHEPGTAAEEAYQLVMQRIAAILATGAQAGPETCESDVSFCTALPNSTGAPATLRVEGSCSFVLNDMELVAEPVPQEFGVFFYSTVQANGGSGFPSGDGLVCVGPPSARLPLTMATGQELRYALDLENLPLDGPFQVGDTRHFQAWYRDPAAQGAGFNFSDAVSVTFGP